MKGLADEATLMKETLDWPLNVDPDFEKKWVSMAAALWAEMCHVSLPGRVMLAGNLVVFSLPSTMLALS